MEDRVQTSARDAVHKFAHFAQLAESGREVLILRRGRPALKLVRAAPEGSLTDQERQALIVKSLGFTASKPYGKKYSRDDSYGD